MHRNLISIKVEGKEYKAWRVSLCNLLHSAVCQHFLSCTFFSNYFQFLFFFHNEKQNFALHQTTDVFMILCILKLTLQNTDENAAPNDSMHIPRTFHSWTLFVSYRRIFTKYFFGDLSPNIGCSSPDTTIETFMMTEPGWLALT